MRTVNNFSKPFEIVNRIPHEEITYHVASQAVIGKLIAYHERFGDLDDCEKDDHENYLLSSSICELELKRAERQLLYEGRRVEYAHLATLDSLPTELGVVEIATDGRRFAIPRDWCIDISGNEELSVETSVVSVLDKAKWPADIYQLWPNCTKALNEIAHGPLVDDIRDLAIHLKLGDRVSFSNVESLEKELYTRVLEKFGLDNIEDVKKLLKIIGLKIIDTSSRLEFKELDRRRTPVCKLSSKAVSSEFGGNAKTEVDALLEAIHKTS